MGDEARRAGRIRVCGTLCPSLCLSVGARLCKRCRRHWQARQHPAVTRHADSELGERGRCPAAADVAPLRAVSFCRPKPASGQRLPARHRGWLSAKAVTRRPSRGPAPGRRPAEPSRGLRWASIAISSESGPTEGPRRCRGSGAVPVTRRQGAPTGRTRTTGGAAREPRARAPWSTPSSDSAQGRSDGSCSEENAVPVLTARRKRRAGSAGVLERTRARAIMIAVSHARGL
jgi:hypothetical protein